MKWRMGWAISLFLILIPLPAAAGDYTFNGIRFTIDDQHGTIRRITSAAGNILDTSATQSGLLTLGYPVNLFLPLQLEAKVSTAQLGYVNNELTISWSKLGPSRNVSLPTGNVSAWVKIKAAADGKSAIMTAHVDNQSQGQVYQVCFPDLQGLRPFAGEAQTLVRGKALFTGEALPHDRDPFYPAALWTILGALRDADLKSASGAGLVIQQKTWVASRVPDLMYHRDEADGSWMRLLWRHKTPLDPGQSWDSGEFWLTRTP